MLSKRMRTSIHGLVLVISLTSNLNNSLQAQVKNLDSLFVSNPADSERDAIIKAFNIILKDGDESYAKWNLYDPYYFNPSSTKPSIYPLINSLRVLREQKFTEALPFTNDPYQYMLSRINLGGIELSLRTGYNYGGGNRLYLSANSTFWDGRTSDAPFNPFPNFSLFEYIYRIQLFLHETRHSDPDDPGHDPNIAGKDTRFSIEGAYARDAIYYMWIYKYGLNNSQATKLLARDHVTNTLIDRFVEMPPTHPNPKIQNLINELLPKIGIQDGNNQRGSVGAILPNLLKVNIYYPNDNSLTIYPTTKVVFRVISVPPNASGYALSSNSSSTLSRQPASVSFKLGDKPGKYLISANAPSFGKDSVVFSLTANTTPVSNAGLEQSKCAGSLVTLDGSASYDADEDPLTYKWTAPTGVSLSSTTALKPTFTAPINSQVTTYTFDFVVNDGVANSKTDQVIIKINPLPASAGAITGAASVCQGQGSVTYTLPAIANATSYIWTLPAGATGTSTTNSITVNFGATAVSGNITVKGHNSCGDGAISTLAVTVNSLPAVAGAITGEATVCLGQASVYYTVAAISNATSYVWTLPTGATGTSNTNNITVTYGASAVSGNITVKGHNTCGDGSVSILAIIVNPLPASAGAITGTASVCQGQGSVTYTVPTILNATSYIWTLPAGATGTSTTNSITVSFGASAVSGNITVKGRNSCGDGMVSNLPVTVNPVPVTPTITQSGKVLSSNATTGNQWYNLNNPINSATAQDYTITTVGEYTVQVTLKGCVSSPSNMIKDVVTSIPSLEYYEKIKVYPNPVLDDLTIEYKGNTDEIKFEIYTSSGKLVKTGVLLENTVVHTSAFSSGVYTIKFNTGKTFEFRKVIKHN